MAEPGSELRFAPESHVCALIEDGDEPATLFAPFLRDGLELGERVVAIAGPGSLDKHRHELEALQTDTGRCEAAGRLQLLPWTQVQGASHEGFDALGTLETLSGILGRTVGNASPATRLLAEIDWIVALAGGSDAVAKYEQGLDQLVQHNGKIAVCVYDVSRLSGHLLIQLLSAHPLTWTRGQLVPSPFYRSAG
jgi:hypothetical protein